MFELGLKKGDKILTVLQNNFEACTVHWSCQITGIIIVPINWRAKAKEIDFFVQDSEAKAIIFQDISIDEVQSFVTHSIMSQTELNPLQCSG